MSSQEQTQTAIQDVLQFQQSAIRQGQRTFEQALDAQQNMTESLWRSNVGAGRNVQQQQTELFRNWSDAIFGAMGTMVPREESHEMRRTLDEQFQELSASQQEAWQAFEDSLEQSMQATDDLTQSQKELLNRSISSFVELQANVSEEMANLVEEMGRQTRQMGEQAHEMSQQVEAGGSSRSHQRSQTEQSDESSE